MNMMCRTLCPQDVYICVDSGRYTHASAHTHLYMVFLFCFVFVLFCLFVLLSAMAERQSIFVWWFKTKGLFSKDCLNDHFHMHI